jgi:uncharacterized protein (TIGR02391 family)
MNKFMRTSKLTTKYNEHKYTVTYRGPSIIALPGTKPTTRIAFIGYTPNAAATEEKMLFIDFSDFLTMLGELPINDDVITHCWQKFAELLFYESITESPKVIELTENNLEMPKSYEGFKIERDGNINRLFYNGNFYFARDICNKAEEKILQFLYPKFGSMVECAEMYKAIWFDQKIIEEAETNLQRDGYIEWPADQLVKITKKGLSKYDEISTQKTEEIRKNESVPMTRNLSNINIIFDSVQLHPLVAQASERLFKDGHYSQAIFEAYKTLNNFVKEKSGRLDLDGKDLMTKVFGFKYEGCKILSSPVLQLNELSSQSDIDEQEGFKFLLMGAMIGIRNPKAHESVTQSDPFRTLEYLALASLLIKKVEEAKITIKR